MPLRRGQPKKQRSLVPQAPATVLPIPQKQDLEHTKELRISFWTDVQTFLDKASDEVTEKFLARLQAARDAFRTNRFRWDGAVWEHGSGTEFDGALRFRVGRVRYRFFVGLDQPRRHLVILSAFTKDAHKWPPQEIERANSRWMRYLSDGTVG